MLLIFEESLDFVLVLSKEEPHLVDELLCLTDRSLHLVLDPLHFLVHETVELCLVRDIAVEVVSHL